MEIKPEKPTHYILQSDNFLFDEEVLYMNKSIRCDNADCSFCIYNVCVEPEKSFPWNNTITWLLYGVYFLVTVVLLIAPKMKK